jgi:hypothetical protein
MRCQECERDAVGEAVGWRAYRADTANDDSESDERIAAVVFYCPACALREFGPVRTRRADGD